jgi:hypothetical protein
MPLPIHVHDLYQEYSFVCRDNIFIAFLTSFVSLYHYKTTKVTAFFEGIADINKKPRCQYHSGAFTILIKYGLIYPG